MSDLIDRDAAIALPPYDSDGDPAGQFDHHIFVKLADLRALPAVEVGVKPLEFDQCERIFHAAGCIIGRYYITEYAGMIEPFKLARPRRFGTMGFPTLEAAKAAAQADYDDRIRSALAVTPAPDAGKVQALVEALESIDVYLSDTLSGRIRPDPATYNEWLIEGIIEARNRARAALAAMKKG